jgi:hypothetical protein
MAGIHANTSRICTSWKMKRRLQSGLKQAARARAQRASDPHHVAHPVEQFFLLFHASGLPPKADK